MPINLLIWLWTQKVMAYWRFKSNDVDTTGISVKLFFSLLSDVDVSL